MEKDANFFVNSCENFIEQEFVCQHYVAFGDFLLFKLLLCNVWIQAWWNSCVDNKFAPKERRESLRSVVYIFPY